MAQTQRRMVYSKIWSSEQFSKLTDKAKLLYIGMITLADDDGRLIANPAYLRGQIFTYYDISISDVLKLRKEVENTGLIFVYLVSENEYVEHPKWPEYQVIRGDLYRPSTLPNRNGKVTKSLQKSTLSKDKISKDNTSESKDSQGKKKLKNMDEDFIDSDTGEYINNKPSNKKHPNAPIVFALFGKFPRNWRINKTQLLAGENLFKEKGIEQIKKAIKFYRENRDNEYCPVVNSPYDLDSKWGKLISFKKKHEGR